MGAVMLAARLVVAAVFLVAAALKLADPAGTRRAVRGFGVPAGMVAGVSVLVPAAELAAVTMLARRQSAWAGAWIAVALLVVFTAAVVVVLVRGGSVQCRCFGALSAAPVGWRTVARNALLAAPAVAVLAVGRANVGPDALPWAGAGAAGAVACVLGAAVAIAAMARPRRLAGANGGGANGGAGLAVGSRAPGFELPDVDGVAVSLRTLLAGRVPVVLVFADPGCGPCNALLPELRRWQDPGRLTLVVVSRGSAAENAVKRDRAGLARVLVQRDREVAGMFGAAMTPSAVIVAGDGTVASELVAGAPAIHDLLGGLADHGVVVRTPDVALRKAVGCGGAEPVASRRRLLQSAGIGFAAFAGWSSGPVAAFALDARKAALGRCSVCEVRSAQRKVSCKPCRVRRPGPSAEELARVVSGHRGFARLEAHARRRYRPRGRRRVTYVVEDGRRAAVVVAQRFRGRNGRRATLYLLLALNGQRIARRPQAAIVVATGDAARPTYALVPAGEHTLRKLDPWAQRPARSSSATSASAAPARATSQRDDAACRSCEVICRAPELLCKGLAAVYACRRIKDPVAQATCLAAAEAACETGAGVLNCRQLVCGQLCGCEQPDQVPCGRLNECTSVTSNANCGDCGVACAPGKSCQADIGGEPTCNCANQCPEGAFRDPESCECSCIPHDPSGCPPGAVQDITRGCQCVCPPAKDQCGGECVDTSADTRNCGGCGRACPPGEGCVDGACVCGQGRERCGGECVDTSSDPRNCGGCGHACKAGGVCHDGRCSCETATCPQGQHPDPEQACECVCDSGELCDGGCVDVDSDPANCGSCGNTCADGDVCVSGECRCVWAPTGMPGIRCGTGCCPADHTCVLGCNGQPNTCCRPGEVCCGTGCCPPPTFCCPTGGCCEGLAAGGLRGRLRGFERQHRVSAR
jgi:hypothetical protein